MAHDPHEPRYVCYVEAEGYFFGTDASMEYREDDPQDIPREGDECDCTGCTTDFFGAPLPPGIEDLDGADDQADGIGGSDDGIREFSAEGDLLQDADDLHDPALLVAQDRDVLWAILRSMAQEYRRVNQSPMEPRVILHMPCGRIVVYRAFDDIPKYSTLCDCHTEWVIRYEHPGRLR
jgi:hypothetical protein